MAVAQREHSTTSGPRACEGGINTPQERLNSILDWALQVLIGGLDTGYECLLVECLSDCQEARQSGSIEKGLEIAKPPE